MARAPFHLGVTAGFPAAHLTHAASATHSRGARTAGDRERTLRGAIDWPWNLLEPWEQDALAQCAVFRGGFALEAAERVLDLSAHPGAPAVLDVVHALRAKSLLRVYEPPEQPGRLRFGLYLTIRDYAAARWSRARRTAAARSRSCRKTSSQRVGVRRRRRGAVNGG
jgi:predicted ATPase